MNIFVEILLFYMLYRLIVGFIIPVFKTSRQVRRQFEEMKTRQNGFNGNPAGTTAQTHSEKPSPEGSRKVGEYIDFEEVK